MLQIKQLQDDLDWLSHWHVWLRSVFTRGLDVNTALILSNAKNVRWILSRPSKKHKTYVAKLNERRKCPPSPAPWTVALLHYKATVIRLPSLLDVSREQSTNHLHFLDHALIQLFSEVTSQLAVMAHSSTKAIVLTNCLMNLPNAWHSSREHHQITCTKAHGHSAFGLNGHLAFQQQAGFLFIISPRKGAGLTCPNGPLPDAQFINCALWTCRGNANRHGRVEGKLSWT